MERFAGLNIRGLSPMKAFVGILLWEYFCGALASSVYYLIIAKYSQENFRNTLKNCKSLARQIFPCLQYIFKLYLYSSYGMYP